MSITLHLGCFSEKIFRNSFLPEAAVKSCSLKYVFLQLLTTLENPAKDLKF